MDSQAADKMVKIRGFKYGSTDRLVQANVTRNPDGSIGCAIAGSSCTFSLPKMMRFTFARHFLLQHPRETEQKGFLEKTARLVHEREDSRSAAETSQSNLVSDFVEKAERGYCCRMDVASKCAYVQEGQISVSSFARHFREAHLVLARKHGFFRHSIQEPEERPNLEKHKEIQRMMANMVPQEDPDEPKQDLFTRVRKHVAFHSGRSHCNITEAKCKYSQQIFKAALFKRHFCIRHPVESIKHGFYDGFQRNNAQNSEDATVSTIHGKRKKTCELVEENVMFDASGVHCRISATSFCRYIQLSYSPVNFMRHFRIVHPAEAYAKGMMYKQTRAKRKKLVVESDASQSESSDSEDEEEVPTSEELSCEIPPVMENAFDESSWINVPSDDPSEYCRLCFSVAQSGEQIFSSSQDTTSNRAALIAECTGIQLTASEDYPAAICHDCCVKLTDIRRFRLLCETLNRVAKRDRVTDQSKVSEVEVFVSEPALESIVEPAAEHLFIKSDEHRTLKVAEKPAATLRPSSPPPLIPFSETAAEKLSIKPSAENSQSNVVVELSDSDEDMESATTEVPAEDVDDDDQPYISLQDNWYCCKLCNQIHQKFEVMANHLENNHPELGFKNYLIENAKKGRQVVEYAEVVLDGRVYLKCTDCDTLMLKKISLARHWRNYHKENEKKQRLLCNITGCRRNFMESKGLTLHLKLQHNITSPAELITQVVKCISSSKA